LAGVAGLSLAISDQHSAKPFTARDVNGAKGEVIGTWYLAVRSSSVFNRRAWFPTKAKYQVPVLRVLCGK